MKVCHATVFVTMAIGIENGRLKGNIGNFVKFEGGDTWQPPCSIEVNHRVFRVLRTLGVLAQ
jgi:hypothetical protein